MIEILGTMISDGELIGVAVGGLIGAFLIASTLYIVAKIKHETEIIDAANQAALDGEEYPSYKLEKVKTWYKGYKLGLVECLVIAFLGGCFAGILGAHLGWVSGAIEVGALGGLAAIVGGFLMDYYIIHPIADGSFMEKVETPMIELFRNGGADAADALPDETLKELKELAQKLKDKGII